MKKIIGLQRTQEHQVDFGDINPRGVSHTVSYATSFDETWNHIRIELKKLSVPVSML
ncbi:MAG: hypothetical protein WA958_09645 [Tunicatimonas sp.]